jgi:MFS family permease
MVGFACGGVLLGRLADRHGVFITVLVGVLGLALGFTGAGLANHFWVYVLCAGLLVGMVGSSAMFSPLVADASLWFNRRRGLALAICMSGNYFAGAIWPPVIQHYLQTAGWQAVHLGVAAIAVVVVLPAALVLRPKPPMPGSAAAVQSRHAMVSERPLGMAPVALQALLCVAGLACCVAMAMPQVHIVAYCTDLGFGAAQGARMLSLMLATGIASRLISGWISDHIGGLKTLLLGSVLQGVALLLFLPFDGLVPLYVVSALFGLFQGGIVPSYALIVREYFTPQDASARVGAVLMTTILGMALGGWMSGVIFDWTGSYKAAFWNGIAFNGLNLAIVVYLLHRRRLLQRA